MEVQAIKCPTCGYTIYSRSRHDFHYCNCGNVAIDGGFDYVKISANPAININDVHVFPLQVSATKEELYNDWNTGKNKFGWLKED